MALLGTLNQIADSVGLNEWDLQNGWYNGFQFVTIEKSILDYVEGANLGIISSVAGAYNTISDRISQQIGQSKNENRLVPAGTIAGLLGVTDTPRRNLVVSDLPNGGRNIRDMGFTGNDISMIVIFTGDSYQTALQNVTSMFMSDQEISSDDKNYHVLRHPLYKSPITKCWIDGYRILSQPNARKTAIIEFIFKTEQPIGVNIDRKSNLEQLMALADTILDVTNALSNAWDDIMNQINSGFPLGIIGNLFNDVKGFINNIIGSTKDATSNLAPSGFNNIGLNKATATPNSSVFIYQYLSTHYTPQDISNAIEKTGTQADDMKNILINNKILINLINVDEQLNMINSCTNAFNQYLLYLIDVFYNGTFYYLLPKNMDIMQVLTLNDLSPENDMDNVLSLNQGLMPFLIDIPKGTKLLLPKNQ